MVADACCASADLTNQYVRIYWTIRSDGTFQRIGEAWSVGFTTVDRQTCVGTYVKAGSLVLFSATSAYCWAVDTLRVAAGTSSMTMDIIDSAPYPFTGGTIQLAHLHEVYARQAQ